MAGSTRICKVCGVEYPYCKTVVKDGVFRYQDVACCAEHGSIYLAQIMESRGMKPAKDTAKEVPVVKDVKTVEEATVKVVEEKEEPKAVYQPKVKKTRAKIVEDDI